MDAACNVVIQFYLLALHNQSYYFYFTYNSGDIMCIHYNVVVELEEFVGMLVSYHRRSDAHPKCADQS